MRIQHLQRRNTLKRKLYSHLLGRKVLATVWNNHSLLLRESMDTNKVSFYVRHHSFMLQPTLSTKRHLIGVFLCSALFIRLHKPMPSTKRHLIGVFLCSASFIRTTTHTKHKMMPLLVSFGVQCIFSPAYMVLIVTICI